MCSVSADLSSPAEVGKKALVLTEAEKLQRREENARRRKRQTEQRLQDEQVGAFGSQHWHWHFLSCSARPTPSHLRAAKVLLPSPSRAAALLSEGRRIPATVDTSLASADCTHRTKRSTASCVPKRPNHDPSSTPLPPQAQGEVEVPNRRRPDPIPRAAYHANPARYRAPSRRRGI